MGTEQDDPHAARRAEMEQTFQSLPAAGTPDYWRRIEQATRETALPLEVLARCVRERAHAGARDQASRVFHVILGRIQRTVQVHVKATVRRSAGRDKEELARDLEQEYYKNIWKELIDNEPTWFYESFTHRLERVMSHAAHSFMEREGLWKRRNVATPHRVPAIEQESLDRPISPSGQVPLSHLIPDPTDGAYARVDLETDIAALLEALQPEDRDLLRDLYWSELTQEQVAERLDVTDRTIRNRLTRILKQLREEYLGGEEDEHGE